MSKKYFFIAIGRKSSEDSHIISIEFPGLDLGLPITEVLQLELRKGFREFLAQDFVTDQIREKLDAMEADNEIIQPLTALEIRQNFGIKPHDRLEQCEIEHRSKLRSRYCERFLPTVMKFTLATELTLLIPILSAAVGGAEMEFFSANPLTAKGTGSMLSAFFMIYNIRNLFSSAGANNMSGFGSIFDNGLHTLWRKITCRKSSRQKQQKQNNCNRLKRWTAKGAYTSLCVGALFADFLLNYEQLQSMEAQVTQMAPYTFFPEKLILISMQLNWYLNQINDPIYAISFIDGICTQLNKKYPSEVSPFLLEEKMEEPRKADDQNYSVQPIQVVLQQPIQAPQSVKLVQPVAGSDSKDHLSQLLGRDTSAIVLPQNVRSSKKVNATSVSAVKAGIQYTLLGGSLSKENIVSTPTPLPKISRNWLSCVVM